jgi:hypothetical protein
MRLPGELEERPVCSSKNISPDIVGDLDFLLTGERQREPHCIRDESNVTVFQLDDELVSALANLRDDRLVEVADEWGVFDFSDTADLLSELRGLAQTALAQNDKLFLCF